MPIQTKISVRFDPIIYPLASHQLAGRWSVLHMDSWCVPGVKQGWAIYQYYRTSWYCELSIIVLWWFTNYRHIVFTLLVVLLHKIRHTCTLPEIYYLGRHTTNLRLRDTKINKCNYVDVPSCMHAHYGDSCHFAIVKGVHGGY